jgi:hypothetical protein
MFQVSRLVILHEEAEDGNAMPDLAQSVRVVKLAVDNLIKVSSIIIISVVIVIIIIIKIIRFLTIVVVGLLCVTSARFFSSLNDQALPLTSNDNN